MGLRNLAPEVSSNFPFRVHFGAAFHFEFGSCGLTADWVLVLASGYRVRISLKPDFSNLPFLRFSGLKRQTGVGLRNLAPEVSSNFPFRVHFGAALHFEFGSCGLLPSTRGRFEKTSPSSFSNLPLFGVFKAEAFQKGLRLRNLLPPCFVFRAEALKKGQV